MAWKRAICLSILALASAATGCSHAAKPKEEAPADPLGALAKEEGDRRDAEEPPKPAAVSLRVLIGGDVLPHRPRLADASKIAAALAPLTPFFKASDGVVVNYESATGDPDHALKMAYVAPPDWLAALHTSGVSAVTVANNHACDMGAVGVRTTLTAADAAGLLAIGGDAHAPFAPRVIAEKDGKRVCAVAWTNMSNAPA
jgi:poly-gamma-glutamate capsule biosynthesis protein CapA/YwtB (metallophosphatase superfamily)